jgi:hypothetical protein
MKSKTSKGPCQHDGKTLPTSIPWSLNHGQKNTGNALCFKEFGGIGCALVLSIIARSCTTIFNINLQTNVNICMHKIISKKSTLIVTFEAINSCVRISLNARSTSSCKQVPKITPT